jgi:hypothetical protein
VQDSALAWPEKMLQYGAKILSDESFEELFDPLPARMAAQFDGGLPF